MHFPPHELELFKPRVQILHVSILAETMARPVCKLCTQLGTRRIHLGPHSRQAFHRISSPDQRTSVISHGHRSRPNGNAQPNLAHFFSRDLIVTASQLCVSSRFRTHGRAEAASSGSALLLLKEGTKGTAPAYNLAAADVDISGGHLTSASQNYLPLPFRFDKQSVRLPALANDFVITLETDLDIVMTRTSVEMEPCGERDRSWQFGNAIAQIVPLCLSVCR